MVTEKMVVIKLFYNQSDKSFYVQIGTEMLFIVRDKIAARIQEKEGIEIRHVQSVKDMQTIDL